MRIISGEFKGRRFHPPANNWPTRPTTDIAKEGLFNILANLLDFSETKMLDLFGGTGSHTYEALSRGCSDITYVDLHRPAIKFVEKTLTVLDCKDQVRVLRADVLKYLEQKGTVSFDYIFAGPPYGMPLLDELPNMVCSGEFLSREGIFVLEHNANHAFADHPNFWQLRTYGGTHFSFFLPEPAK